MSRSTHPNITADHEDDRTPGTDGYNPLAALAECYDLWASGAWPDENAVYNLEEVMTHVQHFLDPNAPTTD